MATWNRWSWIIALAIGAAFMGCDPEAIAPLPSPTEPPDQTQILTSSLAAAEEGRDGQPQDGLVAVVGFDGAVFGTGMVRIRNAREEDSLLFPTYETGSFAGAVKGQLGDVIAVSFIDEDGQESESVTLTVGEYTPPEDRALTGGAAFEYGPQEPAENFAPPSADPDTQADDKAYLPLIVYLGDDAVRLSSAPEFIGPFERLVVANQTRGQVHVTVADGEGAINITFAGAPGDEIVLFSQSSQDLDLTSPAKKFVVPEL